MRAVLAVVGWLVAVAALAVCVPSAWVATHVTSADGWVELTEPLATDPALESALVDEVTTQLSAQGVPAMFRAPVREVVAAAARSAVDDPGWSRAWAESLRRSHRMVLDAQAGDRVTIDIAPLAAYVLDRLDDGRLPVRLEAPDRIVVPLDATVDRQALDRVEQAPSVALASGVVAAVGALVTLLAARRRTVALAWLGAGGVLVTAAGLVLSRVVLPEAADRQVAATAFARAVRDLFVDRVGDSFDGWVLVLGAVSLALALLGGLGALVTGRRRTAPVG